ncbi:hypothetical protein BDQ17DRAFT_1430294 [Cyathus striatus]|nr:hypothetical protein BDQ17DRAFT_1430294 [Cyathus striatus]
MNPVIDAEGAGAGVMRKGGGSGVSGAGMLNITVCCVCNGRPPVVDDEAAWGAEGSNTKEGLGVNSDGAGAEGDDISTSPLNLSAKEGINTTDEDCTGDNSTNVDDSSGSGIVLGLGPLCVLGRRKTYSGPSLSEECIGRVLRMSSLQMVALALLRSVFIYVSVLRRGVRFGEVEVAGWKMLVVGATSAILIR